jgi:hypothetical protein
MARCQIKGCTNESGINPKTGRSNLLCRDHFMQAAGGLKTKPKGLPSSPKNEKGPKKKPKTSSSAPKVELFVLRGHTLTINYTGKTKHVNVDRLTRAVKYNDDKQGSSGKTFHFIIDIKQGLEIVTSVLFDDKKERDQEFARLQALLSSVY